MNDGVPAFPSLYPRSDEDGRQGMSLRDYFAAHALSGLLADPDVAMGPEECSKTAYKYADAMIEARKKESGLTVHPGPMSSSFAITCHPDPKP